MRQVDYTYTKYY